MAVLPGDGVTYGGLARYDTSRVPFLRIAENSSCGLSCRARITRRQIFTTQGEMRVRASDIVACVARLDVDRRGSNDGSRGEDGEKDVGKHRVFEFPVQCKVRMVESGDKECSCSKVLVSE